MASYSPTNFGASAFAGPVRGDVAVSVVIPIYNEEELVDALHQALVDVLESIGERWQIVYVNDGSTDRTLDLLLNWQSTDPRVTVVELSRNWGHQAALTAGLQVARGAAVVLMDGDFQDPPETIPALVDAWQQGAQVVIAQRRMRHESGFRAFMYPLFYKFFGFLSDYPIPLNTGIFGLIDRQVVNAINSLGENNRYLPGLRSWVGFRTATIYYDRANRAGGRPKQTFWRLLRYALDAIFSFSYKPLRLSLVLGVATAVFALLYAGVLLLTRSTGVNMPGRLMPAYTSTIVSVLFMGGIQLICTGLLGEYIGRIYDEVKRRPLFVIRTIHQAEARIQINESARGTSIAAD